MKQLDLFEIPPSLPLAREEVGSSKLRLEPSTPLAKEGLGEIGKPTKPTLDQQRLAHYRAKLAKLDLQGYDEVAEVITSDTIHGHNQLGRDMKIVGTLRQLQWIPEAIANYFLTRRIKNNRTVENGRDRSKGNSK